MRGSAVGRLVPVTCQLQPEDHRRNPGFFAVTVVRADAPSKNRARIRLRRVATRQRTAGRASETSKPCSALRSGRHNRCDLAEPETAGG